MSGCPKIPRDCQIYTLDSLDWSACPGGHHHTGFVTWNDKRRKRGTSGYHRYELEWKLSLREAKEMYPDRSEGYWRISVARSSNRFNSAAQLERAATQWVTSHCDYPNWLLIEHDWGNPCRPIAAKGWYEARVPMMTALAAKWDKVPDSMRVDSDRESTPLWNDVYRLWYLLLTPGEDITAECVAQTGAVD